MSLRIPVNTAPAMPDDAHERHQRAVLADRVEMLFSGIGPSLLMNLLVALIFVRVHNMQTPNGIETMIWLGSLCMVLMARAVSGWGFRRGRWLQRDPAGWLRIYRVGATLTALVWGAAGVLFYPPDQEIQQVFTLLVLAGITAGALSAMTADYPSYRNFVSLTLVPVGVMAIAGGGQLQISIGALVFLMLAFMLGSSRSNAQAILDSLTLHYENAELLADLEIEKNRVIDQAETMMGSILSCVPIALWAIDRDGVFSFMDGDHLGTKNQLQLPAVGDNLFDAFAGHPQIIYETRRALQGESFVTEIMLQAHDYEVHYSPRLDDQGKPCGAIGVAIDLAERKRHEQQLIQHAHYDQLTGLPNRSLAMSQLEYAFKHAERQKRHLALLFLDLDNFKSINDTMGHKAGDRLLCQAAARLQNTLRKSDVAARLGGDEFLVISEQLLLPEDAEVVAHKITKLFQRPFLLDNREVFATTSVGIAVFPQDGDNAEQLLQSADTAMYHAKAAGKNKYRFFTTEMQATAERHLAMETELRRALRRSELCLLYQPKIAADTLRISGAEALLRWDSPSLGAISPGEFIPVAEVAGLMPQIGEWVLRQACQEAAGWQALGNAPMHVAINVSPQQFRNTDLLANVTQALVESALPPSLLELEITESMLLQDVPETMRVFTDITDLGINLSLDDFGTGYSSLSYLKRFPLKVLKIDRAFVSDLGDQREGDSLVDAIIAMAKSLKLQVVAEGVETEAQLHYLRERGVDLMQGYYFSKPLPAEQFRELIVRGLDDSANNRRPLSKSLG